MNPRIIGAALAGLLAGAAHAHITLEYPVAPAGSSYKATFRVGHGCAASPTRQLAVAIPRGVKAVHPMAKPGWKIDIGRDGDSVVAVTWTAKTPDDALPSAHYDEFALVARLPQEAGAMYWPVRQVCEDGRLDWVEVPGKGQPASQLKSPAAFLEVLPATPRGSHQH